MANFDLMSLFRDKKADVNHSVFDLSKKMAFSLPCSYLTPIYFHPTMPNERHQISLAGIMRTETMNTAAFVSGKVHCNFFFVPFSQLWHPFNSFVSQKKDLHSTQYKGTNFVPVVKLSDLYDHKFFQSGQYATDKDSFGYDMFYHLARMMQVAGYGNIYPEKYANTEQYPAIWESYKDSLFCGTGSSTSHLYNLDRYVNIFPFLAYQHIYYDYYRNKFYDNDPFSYNREAVRYIDTFNVDDVQCHTFGTSILDITSDLTHKTRFRDIIELHPIQYKRDLYTSLLPSSQFGPVSSVEINGNLSDLTGAVPFGITGNGVDRWNGPGSGGSVSYDGSSYNLKAQGSVLSHTHDFSGSLGLEDDAHIRIPSAFDVLSLRRSELLQRWKQNALRAGNMVDDNFEAHYGVKPFYEDDNNVRFLGSFSCTLNVNPVTATSTTGEAINGRVGDLAAIGVGSFEGKEIEFECKDFGLIVAVAAFLPDVYYNANGIAKHVTLNEPFDFPQPEFNNVGFEPVNMWNLTTEFAKSRQVDNKWYNNIDTVLGFASPWSYMKTNIDEVYDEFSSFHWDQNDPQTPDYRIDFDGVFSSWIFKREQNLVRGTFTDYLMKNQLYVNPNTTDAIFGIKYDGTPKTNPFIFSVNLSHKAIRPLSVLGLPEF